MTSDIHPTKLAIMQASVEAFINKGFSGTTTKEIAQKAGISEGTIFRHFQNKTEILYGVVDSFMPLMGVETLKKTIEESKNLDIREAMLKIFRERFETIGSAKALVRIILVEINYDQELRKKYYENVYKPVRRILDDFFAEGIRRGDFKDMDPNLPTTVFFSFVLFVICGEYLTDLEPQKINFNAEELTDVLLNGILKRS